MSGKPVILEAYRGFGGARRAMLMGRVYREPGRSGSFAARLRRRGLGDIEVAGRLDGRPASARTDRDGYFRLEWQGLDGVPAGWRPVEIAATGTTATVTGAPELHVRGPASRCVVISDIDDTVMVTGVANKALMYWRLFFRDAAQRRAFPGVPAFYRALAGGAGGDEDNPVIFVSRGPWSIRDVLDAFFRERGIAERPILLLREWGLTAQSPLPRRARDHKPRLVADVMAVYGEADYVLIGDSGQHDPELYAGIARDRPDRIRAVYIRDVSNDAGRRARIEAMFRDAATLVLAGDTAAMTRHAAEIGLVPADAATGA